MARAGAIRDYVTREISAWSSKGYVVGAYGAAAKGMTLLHFMLDGQRQAKVKGLGKDLLGFVLDDAPLKQDTFCPGTNIPVYPTESLADIMLPLPLALVILAWNFFDEIASKLRATGHEMVAILPFPEPRVVRIAPTGRKVLREMPNRATPIPNPVQSGARKKTAMVTHFRNEQMMLPFFIIHHAPMFDAVVGIDYLSTDKSVEIWSDYAPPGWKIVASNTGTVFDAVKTDAQVMEVEQQYPEHWTIALTLAEFLIYPYMKLDLFLRRQGDLQGQAFILDHPAIVMHGDDRQPLLHYASLIKQRRAYSTKIELPPFFYCRMMHLGTSKTHQYETGRHKYKPIKGNNAVRMLNRRGYIAKWKWTPWPETVQRLMEVGKTIPEADIKHGAGKHHTTFANGGFKKVLESRRAVYARVKGHELCDDVSSDDDLSVDTRRAFFGEVGGACIRTGANYDVLH